METAKHALRAEIDTQAGELERVARAIDAVEKEIEGCEQEIKDSAAEVAKALGSNNERLFEYWSKKEEQLRKEKEQLRKEKEQLQEKEMLLLQRQAAGRTHTPGAAVISAKRHRIAQEEEDKNTPLNADERTFSRDGNALNDDVQRLALRTPTPRQRGSPPIPAGGRELSLHDAIREALSGSASASDSSTPPEWVVTASVYGQPESRASVTLYPADTARSILLKVSAAVLEEANKVYFFMDVDGQRKRHSFLLGNDDALRSFAVALAAGSLASYEFGGESIQLFGFAGPSASASGSPLGSKRFTERFEGVGGTTRLDSDCSGNEYEGLDAGDLKKAAPEKAVLRECKVNKLIQMLDEEHRSVLLVRAPPSAGKTSLAQLLERALLRQSGDASRVFRVSMLWMGTGDNWDFEVEFGKLLGGKSWDAFRQESYSDGHKMTTTLILDEAHLIFKRSSSLKPMHNSANFWDSLKGIAQGGRLRVVLFATYGYLGKLDTLLSPFSPAAESCWTLAELRFSDSEFATFFDQAVRRKQVLGHLSDAGREQLRGLLQTATLGHPGLAGQALDTVAALLIARKYHGRMPSEADVLMSSTSPQFITKMADHARAASSLRHLDDAEKRLCDRVAEGERLRPENVDAESSSRLSKGSMLVTDIEGVLSFAAPLLRCIYLHKRRATRGTEPAPTSLFEFICSVFRNLSGDVLRNSLGTGVDNALLERSWQMEFYRSAMTVLPASYVVSPDVGIKLGVQNGAVDFIISNGESTVWAIELLRGGDRMQQHMDRFSLQGTYHSMLDKVTDFALIDIRVKQDDVGMSVQPSRDKLLVCYVEPNYSQATLCSAAQRRTVQLQR